MQPRWHLIFGAIFTIIIWLSIPNISYIYLGLIFLASIFIDLDHYANAIIRTGKFGPIEMLRHYDKIGKVWDSNHKKGKKIPGYFQPFHTTEAHLIVFLLGFVWAGFYFIFIGMFFHSMLDFIEMSSNEMLYHRHFSFIDWAHYKINNISK
jgi:hypothetical protein